jgi:RNA polymerase sigma-70 factor (ECF subfamily)
MNPEPPPPLPAHPSHFPDTAWEDISAARRGQDDASLQTLAAAYWGPLYFFLRRSGHPHEDASDEVQGFFLHILSTPFFANVERDGAKFRSYLLTSLRNWLARQRTRATAQRRGGGVSHVSFSDLEALKDSPELEEPGTPELLYDRRWARELIARSTAMIRQEYTACGQTGIFAAVHGALPGGPGLPAYPDLASTLGGTEAAARKAIYNLRQRFSEIVRREIRATVQTPQDADEEFEHLFRVLTQAG